MNLSFPPPNRGLLVVWGVLASYPFGGITWQVLHHLVGLRRLGYDVWYVEDSDNDDVYDVETWWRTHDYERNVAFLARQMDAIGLGDRWIFRPPLSKAACFGARDLNGLAQLYRDADAVLHISGYNQVRPEHASIRCLVYLETDPFEVQVGVASGKEWDIRRCAAHDALFTYAENIGQHDCAIPTERFHWQTTRPPVVVDWWETLAPPEDPRFTTVLNWDTSGHELEWRGQRYRWRKDHQFERLAGLPSRVTTPLELAIAHIGDGDADALRAVGWRITSAKALAAPDVYRDYIRSSCGEFSVAKDYYTLPRTGWFSDRSVCYLAAGRPVVLQSTGFEKFVPTGLGLFAFTNLDEAAAALEAITADYATHSAAAQDIAREHFAAEKVLAKLLARLN